MEVTFIREFGLLEIGFCSLFFALYALFAFRTVRVARAIGTSPERLFYKLVLRTSYFALLVLALLGPAVGEERKQIASKGKDIYFLVDVSKSMDATDLQPSRMEKVKTELAKLINELPSDRLGLIIFTSDAFLQCPLTFDHSALLLFTETLNTGLISNAGTDFYPPLKLALEKLQAAKETESTANTASLVVLLSDGEDFGDDTQAVAQQLRNAGISVFTVGLGTKQGSLIPLENRFKRDMRGEEVISRLNPESLQLISNATQGRYFEVSDELNEMTLLRRSLQELEGQLRGSVEMDVSANRYFVFLLLAIIFMLIDLALSVKILKI